MRPSKLRKESQHKKRISKLIKDSKIINRNNRVSKSQNRSKSKKSSAIIDDKINSYRKNQKKK